MTTTLAACASDDSEGATSDGTEVATETTEAAADGDAMADDEAMAEGEDGEAMADEAVDADAMPISGELAFDTAVEAGSQLILSVNDLTKADAEAALVAQETIDLEDGTSPIAFSITVPRADLDRNLRYSLRAQIVSASGEALLTTNSITSIDVMADANELGTVELVSAD